LVRVGGSGRRWLGNHRHPLTRLMRRTGRTKARRIRLTGPRSRPTSFCAERNRLGFTGCGIGIAPFIPASSFLDFNQAEGGVRLAFEVTGDPANVPEPTTAMLGVWGLAPLVLRRRSAEH
jgi:hypothetical protein